METELYIEISDKQLPIIYRKEYNVRFLGLEKMHPFDAKKWGNIYKFLQIGGLVNDETVTVPNEATRNDLLLVHTEKYLKQLNCSFNVSLIAEVLPLCIVPNYLIHRGYLRPMRYQTGGSILAGKLALERGWAINLGGGFHHCSATKGMGFCPYADITLLIRFLFDGSRVTNVMIVDLDAHQGNGYQRDFKANCHIYVFDVYNCRIYPNDKFAKQFISRAIELEHFIKDCEYLQRVGEGLEMALAEFKPDLIVYNAGTDVLEGDPLGCLSITAKGVIQRDELVFRTAAKHKVPIVMLTSGGYLKKSAKIIANSILNLYNSNLIYDHV